MSKSRRRENSESCTSAILFSSMNYLHVGNSSAEIFKYICLNWRWRICWFFFRCDKLFRCLANFFWTFCLFNTCLTVINTEYWVVKLFFLSLQFFFAFLQIWKHFTCVIFFIFSKRSANARNIFSVLVIFSSNVLSISDTFFSCLVFAISNLFLNVYFIHNGIHSSTSS